MRLAPLIVMFSLAACYPEVEFTGKDGVAGTTDAVDDSSGDSDGGDGSADGGGDGGSSGDGGEGSSGGDGDDGASGGDGDDGSTEEGCTVWADEDGDGYGAGTALELEDCDELPSGLVTNQDDCDDTSAAVNPAATETCNGIDDDCDDLVDDDDDDADLTTGTVWYTDWDADGFGDPSAPVAACIQPADTVVDDTDCDDSITAVNPGAVEVCNGADDDCDALVDDDDADVDLTTGSTWYADADSDGHGDPAVAVTACQQPSATVSDNTDCDDNSGAVSPSATEICNSIDDDCDTLVDDDDPSVDTSTGTTFYVDSDADSYGGSSSLQACALPSGYARNGTDCDDGDTSVNPGASEVCNSIDDDCDALVDDDDGDLDVSTADLWYPDGDADGYGDASGTTVTACVEPTGYTDDDTDCDDADSGVNPLASEVCNGIDDDCDSTVDSAAACPCNLERYGNHTYLFCESTEDWHDAEAACQTQTNYELVVIDDATEQAWVWTTAASTDSSRWWWIGFHNQNASASQEPSGGFEWVDGSAVSYTAWASGQPDDYRSDEDCAHIYPNTGRWNDLDCDSASWGSTDLYYVCESTVP